MSSNTIDSIYKNMSRIIEEINLDKELMKNDVSIIKRKLEMFCSIIDELKTDNEVMTNTHATEIKFVANQLKNLAKHKPSVKFKTELDNLNESVEQLKLEISLKQDNGDLRKQIVDLRSLVMRTITANSKKTKAELQEFKKYVSEKNLHKLVDSIILQKQLNRPLSITNNNKPINLKIIIQMVQEQVPKVRESKNLDKLKISQSIFLEMLSKLLKSINDQ